MRTLRLYQTACPVYTLGPFARYGIWVQGCQKRCPGCASPLAQPLDGGYEAALATLCERILCEPLIEGITISGGEPFLQSEALYLLVDGLRKRRDIGVIVYTGCSFEEIAKDPLTGLCDAIIDGNYIQELDDGRALRGSSNQRLACLTERYRHTIGFGSFRRTTELLSTKEGKLSLVGIPGKGDVQAAEGLRRFWIERD